MIAIAIDLGDRTVPAELDESPTALDLLALLPFSAEFADLADQEKLALLPRDLTTRGAPRASGASPGDIGYYAPSHHLVLYYADVAPFPGIVRIGRYPADDVDVVASLPSGTAIALARPICPRS